MGQKQLKQTEGVYFSSLYFRRGDIDALCVLTTCPLSPLYCNKFALIDFFFRICPLKSVDGFLKMVMAWQNA